MSVVVVGVNQRTVSLDVLERVTVGDAELAKALRRLGDGSNLSEVVVLSTCMRTEVYARAERFHAGVADIRDFLSEMASGMPEILDDHIYCYYDDAAVSHLFEVAAGLDSAVLGESEILSQVRRAWERACEEGSVGPSLSLLFRHSVEVGKRARSETGIARGITSVSQAAVALAEERLGGALGGRRILVVGAGDMGEGMAAALCASPRGAEVLVANRTWDRAVELAEQVGGTAVALDDLGAVLERIDVALTSAGAPSAILEAGDLETVMERRAGHPLLIVDVGVPRNVEPAVAELEGVTLLDLDDLRAFAEAGLAGRRREVTKVRRLVAEEVGRHQEELAARQVAPLVTALRRRAEQLRGAELDRQRSRLSALDQRQLDAVEAVTTGLVNKLLHEPTVRLKEAAGSPRGERLAEALAALFDL